MESNCLPLEAGRLCLVKQHIRWPWPQLIAGASPHRLLQSSAWSPGRLGASHQQPAGAGHLQEACLWAKERNKLLGNLPHPGFSSLNLTATPQGCRSSPGVANSSADSHHHITAPAMEMCQQNSLPQCIHTEGNVRPCITSNHWCYFTLLSLERKLWYGGYPSIIFPTKSFSSRHLVGKRHQI